MAELQDTRNGLRGLYQDLSALSNSQLPNVDRLCFELEIHIQDFRKLLDKPAKNNASRQAVLSGKWSLDTWLSQEAMLVRFDKLTSNAIS